MTESDKPDTKTQREQVAKIYRRLSDTWEKFQLLEDLSARDLFAIQWLYLKPHLSDLTSVGHDHLGVEITLSLLENLKNEISRLQRGVVQFQAKQDAKAVRN